MKYRNEIIEAVINQPVKNLSGMLNKDRLSILDTISALYIVKKVSDEAFSKACSTLCLRDVNNLSDEALE